ncbi:Mu transposase C-terminal domain-containing protein [Rhodanobacter sp. Si-c]|uniref:Mu transposase C-terminal domain-containing protein n=1 Tax=Rhodanobacter lycopersici TaxID=3162487 RepID=A0ABV3QG49_9GAMM
MATGSFQVGQRFVCGETSFRLYRPVGDGAWVVEDLGTGSFREEDQASLLHRWSCGELRFYEGADIAPRPSAKSVALASAVEDAYRQSYPDALWKRAVAKLFFVRKLAAVPSSETAMSPLIEESWQQAVKLPDWPMVRPPHFTTVARWIRDYRKAGEDIRALIDRHTDKGNRESRLGELMETIADDVIETVYMTLERRTAQEVLETLRGRVAQQNLGRLASEKLPRPSFNYVKRRISEIPVYDRCVARYGKRLADIKFRAAGLGMPAEKLLARASIDHCRLDLMVVDEESRLPLGRPWLTLILDERSRYVLGFYIGFEEPSAVSVGRAVSQALMPKTELLTAHPQVVNAWDAWGIFSTLVADNGLELHGTALEHAIERFGIKLQFCPRKKPWYKGKLERFFRTFNNRLLDGIPGKTFSSVMDKGDYNPSKHAVVTLSTLREITLIWIVDIYHQKNHRALGRSPAEVWEEEIHGVDRWLPASALETDSAFSRKETRCLTHKGIEFDCLFYNSPELARIREFHGAEIDVEVRVADDDIGSIVVVAPGGRQLVKVPALEREYAEGMTRWQHKVCKRYKRRIQDDESRDISLFVAREKIRELISKDMQLTKRDSRKRQARFIEAPEAARSSEGRMGMAPSMPAASTAQEDAIRASDYLPQEDAVPVFASRRINSLAGGQA